MSASQILLFGVIVAVAAILLGAVFDVSIGIVMIFLLAAGVYLAFVSQGSRRRSD